jgi:hypothetical protein
LEIPTESGDFTKDRDKLRYLKSVPEAKESRELRVRFGKVVEYNLAQAALQTLLYFIFITT